MKRLILKDAWNRELLNCSFPQLPLRREAISAALRQIYGTEKCCYQRETAVSNLLREKLLSGALALKLDSQEQRITALPEDLFDALMLPEQAVSALVVDV